RELADEEVDITRLSTVLHLLQEAGVADSEFVPAYAVLLKSGNLQRRRRTSSPRRTRTRRTWKPS
ncbi:hypothetical protein CTI14_56480, partial [Methylobacterium radiotolerans]